MARLAKGTDGNNLEFASTARYTKHDYGQVYLEWDLERKMRVSQEYRAEERENQEKVKSCLMVFDPGHTGKWPLWCGTKTSNANYKSTHHVQRKKPVYRDDSQARVEAEPKASVDSGQKY